MVDRAAACGCCDRQADPASASRSEPVNRYETSLVNTVAQGLELIEQVDESNLGLLFDTFHANIEEPSIERSLIEAGTRLFHVHVADSNRWHPGAGHLDFATFFGALSNTGYTGFVSGEFMPLPDPDTAAAGDRALEPRLAPGLGRAGQKNGQRTTRAPLSPRSPPNGKSPQPARRCAVPRLRGRAARDSRESPWRSPCEARCGPPR